jgi:hypothetical protein
MGQRPGASSDTVSLTSAMLDMTLIRPGTIVLRAYVLPCDYSPGPRPREFGTLREKIQLLKRGDSTMILQITRAPLLSGGYVLDSALYDARTLAPLRGRARSRSLFVEMHFRPDSLAWHVEQPGHPGYSGGARIPSGAYSVVSDRLLVRALKNPAALSHKLARLTFVDMPGPETDVAFEGYLGVSQTDSVPFPSVRAQRAWAIALGSGADKVFFVDARTHELLGWEQAELEGTCPLRYVRLRQTAQ